MKENLLVERNEEFLLNNQVHDENFLSRNCGFTG